MKKTKLIGMSVVLVLTMAANGTAWGDARVHHRWSGDIHRFGHHDFPTWRTGYWHHGRHGGRFGWWWVVGGLWYFYPGPIYPYPDPYVPPALVVNPPAAAVEAPAPQYWYYCEWSKGYYPFVKTCPGGWKAVPASPAPGN